MLIKPGRVEKRLLCRYCFDFPFHTVLLQKYARQMPCDVWVGHIDYSFDNNTYEDAYTYEIYFLKVRRRPWIINRQRCNIAYDAS